MPSPSKEDREIPSAVYASPHVVLLPFAHFLNDKSTPIQYTWSIGTGIQWAQIHLDVAYTYTLEDRDMNYDEVELLKREFNRAAILQERRLDEQELLPQNMELQRRNHHIGFTFTGYF